MSYNLARGRGLIVPFTGNLNVTRADEGKIFRCDDTANVTVTFNRDLSVGFNCGFTMYSTGTVTLGASPGVTNLLAKTALSTRYQAGSMMVMQRTANFQGEADVGATIEYLVGGDFA
ncbi:hypothetical protein [Bradyrhizobium sp. 188]|uniref:hypothetical protein n=1 Tax=Bradyrhizobium sp. 188 TaxID=2782656 RepID=UPI001FF7A2AC|nr:hypothetical protein [Bradyrhizobium sp. 188]MCK1498009.1 hypothetical protein [Bradyrhizobium sp. 188]